MNRFFVLLLGALLIAAPVAAQTPVADIYAGYSILNDDELEETFTTGLVLSLAFSVSDNWSIPLEYSWHKKDLEVLDEDVASVTIQSYMGGFRYGRSFYIQVLAGAATAGVDFLGVDESETEFAIQPGLGFDVPVGSSVAIRIGGDYRRIFSDPGVNEWRGHAGLVFRLGSR
jgi:opacity protein-like surface antigen